MPQLSTSIAYLLSHIMQPSVYCGELVCAGQGRASLQGGLEWPLHDQPGSHSGSHGAFVSQSNLAASYLPSIHPSLPVLPACPCACCSLSRYNRARPWWLLLREQRVSHLGHRRDWREAGRGQRGGQQQTRCVLKDRLNQSYFLPQCSFDFQEKERRKRIPNRWNHARFVIVSGRAFSRSQKCVQ